MHTGREAEEREALCETECAGRRVHVANLEWALDLTHDVLASGASIRTASLNCHYGSTALGFQDLFEIVLHHLS